MRLISLILIIFTLSYVSPRSKEEWKTRAIYHIITDRFARSDDLSDVNCDLSNYCGGTFQGIINKLDYIKGMGFDAILISPVVENAKGSYHGYHTTNFYNINYHFGDENSLKNLVNTAHSKDIWVMVDVNAVSSAGRVGYDLRKIIPFNKEEHYTRRCDYCPLVLKVENGWVSTTLCNWVKELVSKYNFDGVRFDTVPEQPKWFWNDFSKAAGVFQIGEVFNGNPTDVALYQNHMDSVLNYPLYYKIKDSFCGSMYNLENYWQNDRNSFPDPSVLGVFVENHDNPRFLNMCNDKKKFKNAVIFSIMYEGIPVFYYGGEQWYTGGADPGNREPLWGNYNTNSEMYQALAVANKVRKENQIWNKKVIQRYADDVFYAFTRGNVLVCLTRGESCSKLITYHEFEEGTKLCNAFDENDCIYVSGGALKITMGTDPKIYVKK